MRLWNLLKDSVDIVSELKHRFNVPDVFAKVLSHRGYFVETLVEEKFGVDDFSFFSNIDFFDVTKAAMRVERAIESKEKICVYGDYDADGVSSTAMLVLYLRERGGDVVYYIPDRNKEGYGINVKALKGIRDRGVKLIITVDNGVTAVKEVSFAAKLGLDVIVTDHHQVPDVIPKAVAVVDPHRKECNSSFKDMAGVGVVFCFICFLEGGRTSVEELLKKYSVLAMIGTLGDVVPLVSQNRILVKCGLKNLEDTEYLGVKKLLENRFNAPSAFGVTYGIVPKINAAGRVDDASKSVELLIARDERVASGLARSLDDINKKRRKVEQDIFACIDPLLSIDTELACQKIIIVDGYDWAPGVIGIVAARLLEKYHKPVVVITKLGEVARGSARSVPGFSIYDVLNTCCSKYLLRFGGHHMAAGFDIYVADIQRLKTDIFDYVEKVEVPAFALNIDAEVCSSDLTYELAEYVSQLEPFGKCNEKPLFRIKNVALESIVSLKNDKHLKLFFSDVHNNRFTVFQFFKSKNDFLYRVGDVLDLVVSIETNVYNGTRGVTVVLVEVKFSDLDEDLIIKQRRAFEKLMTRGRNVVGQSETNCTLPERNDFALVYRYIKSYKAEKINGDISVFYYRLGQQLMPFGRFLLILYVFCETGLIDFTLAGDAFFINVRNVNQKVNLEKSPTLSKICGR